MARFADRVKETATTTGTGDFTLAGAVSNFQSFNTAFGLDASFYYAIVHQSAAEWEVGIGHLSDSTTFVRATVFESTNSDALVSFAAGTKDVFCTIAARPLRNPGQLLAMVAGWPMP